MTGQEIRERFLRFFEERGHTIVPSDSLVPASDPSLLFTSAGMVQFKAEFMGEVPLKFTRSVTCQRCFRTTDVDIVGTTARHHTFFEMLGNFSFGDYFKEEAISWGWEFVTKDLALPKSRLWISIFEDDDEAHDIWRKIGLPERRIIRLGEGDNFWKMGPTGPCGPCSEIYFDVGKDRGCDRPDCAVGCDCDRYLELWNLVFTQFDRAEDGTLTPLPQKNIDTGMGLERTAVVMQGVGSNFETDLFKPIVDYTAELTDRPYEGFELPHRIIADHLRAVTFLIADGVLPSNEGRGYVERKILRRAVFHGTKLGMDEPFLYRVVGAVVDRMQDAYPYLADRREHVSKVVLTEEERFQETLLRGMGRFEEVAAETEKSGSRVIPGKQFFRLVDTFGLPTELIAEMAKEKDLSLDEAGFEEEMEQQRQRAREAAAATFARDATGTAEYGELPWGLDECEFVGYTQTECQAELVNMLKDGALAEEAGEGEEIAILLDVTPFYAEAGGQVGDQGIIEGPSGTAEVLDTLWAGKALILHRSRVKKGTMAVGDRVTARVNAELRTNTALHHSSTHLLQYALREVLGTHVHQTGSLVETNRFRFDYSHFTAPDKRQLDRIEEIVNAKVRSDDHVETAVMPLEKAKEAGAIALFGEKYTDQVRMVQMGDYSKELCGGTHVHSTGQIGYFQIVSESSVAAGTRRIEAVCGPAAYEKSRREREALREVSVLLNVAPVESPERLAKVLEEKRALEKEIERMKEQWVSRRAPDLLSQAREVSGVKVLAVQLDNVSQSALRSAADEFRAKMGSGVVVLGTVSDKKVLLIAAVTPDLTSRIHAGKLAGQVAKLVGGGGGGRPDMAQAGGKDPSKLPSALGKVPELVAEMTG